MVALAALSVCLGAVVAYAKTRPEKHRDERLLLHPRFLEAPEAVTTAAEPQFRFHVPPRPGRERPGPPARSGAPAEAPPPRRFQCRLDGGEWRACSSPHRLASLGLGEHSLSVRALTRDGLPGPVASYSWRRVERPPAPQPQTQSEPVDPKPFAIEARADRLTDLHPGDPPQQLPVLVRNPNPVPIEVVGLTVAIADDPPSCAAENFATTPSSASPAAPLTVPAGGSASLPSATVSAPAIAMLNLPVNQDACRGAAIPLVFSGEARG